MKTIIKNQIFDEERAFYGSNDIEVDCCKFDGPADGESALKESKNIKVRESILSSILQTLYLITVILIRRMLSGMQRMY